MLPTGATSRQICDKSSGPKAKHIFFLKENAFLAEPQFSSKCSPDEKHVHSTNVRLHGSL